ncbi:MAG TPA: YdeI/OmpD-associated family protein [Phnomibacter sp.]|nr:YdeI/OmpD-associated family protein [Phnomibacter sp.]
MNPEVDWFFKKPGTWQEAYLELRDILLGTELVETLKWGVPCYVYNGKNVVLIHGFNEYCALLFHQGALLKDTKGVLVQQTKNVQAARQYRFTHVEEIIANRKAILAFVKEAIANEKKGLKVVMKATAEFEMPEEFRKLLKEMPDLKKAFESLTPGRQRGYLLHFSQAKQATTRIARIEKYMDKILSGKGLED